MGVCATDAYGVFEEVGCEVGNEITYNAIIAGLVNMEKDEDALSLFIDMQTVGLRPTALTFVSVMGACLFSKIASQVHGQAIKMSFEEYTSVGNAAISMYSNCGELDAARLVFRRLKEKHIVSWNAIIASYAQEYLEKDAILAYLQMQREGIEPGEFTFGSLLASSELVEVVEMIQAIFQEKDVDSLRKVVLLAGIIWLSASCDLFSWMMCERLKGIRHMEKVVKKRLWYPLVSGSVYTGVDFCKKLCGVSLVRSGESMEIAL
ncbi:Pentatricopeptide repeat-containing protein [Sesamum alatum]|uniref:Pentatricopeptide repeat-containing protein n=1 Tax=Sesamum alatum TaxID=300844 RepID=A0AAE1YRD8_9LAMI|nr:Pentatricopeptide repeat-containing protein [Sesamum alatum]